MDTRNGVVFDRSMPQPANIARAIVDGFDRHYRSFRYVAQRAKQRYEHGDWHGMRESARDRIDFYDQRVREAVGDISRDFDLETLTDEERDALWQAVKQHFVALLADHRQPECAETFFNSVCTKLLNRKYYRNSVLFVRPGVATEYMDSEPPSYRSYYPLEGAAGAAGTPGAAAAAGPSSVDDALSAADHPGAGGRRDRGERSFAQARATGNGRAGLRRSLRQILIDFGLACPWVDVERDIRRVIRAACKVHRSSGAPNALLKPFKAEADCQIQVLSSLFFRNKGANIIGRIINGTRITPFAVPILRNHRGQLYLDTVLFSAQHISTLFSFTRAYFLVDMEAPAAYVEFLRTLLPNKPAAEIYTMVGLQKQGKTLFYRDFLHHLRHSSDEFAIAPGIKGLVMVVFTLPSYPYVFKMIKDVIPHPKETDREQIKSKYQLVKLHDRVGRMADTWEYSDVALPRARCSRALLRELLNFCPSLVEITEHEVLIKHVYIERRMTPLNIYLSQASDTELDHAVREYGNAIKDLTAANIFPGDMLYKNFGVTRLNRVVFYDYDEIEYMTDCNFRRIPPPRNDEDELSGETWYHVGKLDVFPEQFGPFLLGDPRIRTAFLRHHADLLTQAFWQIRKERIQAGLLEDVFPYPGEVRFGAPAAAR